MSQKKRTQGQSYQINRRGIVRTLLRSIACLWGITSLLNSVQAETIVHFNDRFDGSISGDWVITGTDANSTATADSSESSFSSGSGSLKLNDNSESAATGEGEVNIRYTLPAGESVDTGESLRVEFDYYIAHVNTKIPTLQIQDGTSTAGHLVLYEEFKNKEGSSIPVLDAISPETWYRVSYTYHNNEGDDTVDISLTHSDGTIQRWNDRLVKANKTSVNSVYFLYNVGASTISKEWWIDNVKVTEIRPEPSRDTWFENLQTTKLKSDPNLIWEQFGPGMSGNNYRIYWHPTDVNTAFLGPNMGMAYRTIDKGFTYEGIFDEDGVSFSHGDRGPVEIGTPDFSRQNENLGFCTGEDAKWLYKTVDKGKTWTRHTVSEPVFAGMEINSITVDPTNDSIWYVGSGNIKEINKWAFNQANPHGIGAEDNHVAKIWKTTNPDDFDSWEDITPTGIDPEAQIQRIIVHPGNSLMIFAATNYGFYRSDDGGETWTEKNTGLDRGIIRSLDIHYDVNNVTTTDGVTLYVIDQVHWKSVTTDNPALFTAENDGGGIFKSTDNGESWHRINGDLAVNIDALQDDCYNFRASYWKALDKWFGINNASSIYKGVYPTELLQNVSVVRVDPNNQDKLFVLNDYKHWGGYTTFKGGMLWRTDNGGGHWFPTLRNGTAWENQHKAYWESRHNPSDPVAHNMELRGQHEWQQREDYEEKAGGTLEFNADSSVIMFQWAKVLCRSFDGGDTWVEDDEIEATPGSHNYVSTGNSNLPGHGFAQDPRYPNTLFSMAGENDYWVSTHDGWNIRSSALAGRRNSLGNGEFSCSDIAFHPTDKDTIYSLQFRQKNGGDLLKSIDGGKNFTVHGQALTWPGYGTKDYSTNKPYHQLCFTLDPNLTESGDVKNMYFCVPKNSLKLGYVDTHGEKFGVRKSSDGGKTWKWSNTGLPNAEGEQSDVPCIRMDPNDSSKLYACVYRGGLYVSNDYGENWEKLSTFPSNVTSVLDLHFSADGKIYASCGDFNEKPENGGVWVSEDNGANWTQFFKSNWVRMTTTAAYDPYVIMVQVNSWKLDEIKNPGTFLSKDGGETWSKINKGNPQSDRVNEIAIDMFMPDVYYVSTYGSGWHRGTIINPSLKKGYNLVSLSSLSDDAQPGTTFDSMLTSIDFVKGAAEPAFTQANNDLGALSPYAGYLIKTNADAELAVHGPLAPPPSKLNLIAGENLVPVIGRGPVLPLVYLSEIENDIIYIRDEKGNTMRNVNGNWVNNIGFLIGGKSYVVKTDKIGIITIR